MIKKLNPENENYALFEGKINEIIDAVNKVANTHYLITHACEHGKHKECCGCECDCHVPLTAIERAIEAIKNRRMPVQNPPFRDGLDEALEILTRIASEESEKRERIAKMMERY